jgi:hypothetical protein
MGNVAKVWVEIWEEVSHLPLFENREEWATHPPPRMSTHNEIGGADGRREEINEIPVHPRDEVLGGDDE